MRARFKKWNFYSDRVEVRIEGFQIGKLLDAAAKNGILLRSVQVYEETEAQAEIAACDLKQLQKLAGARYRVKPRARRGAADLVIGKKSGNDQVLLTLAERKSREYWMLPIKNREADSVMEAFQELQETYSEHFGEVFKTVTTDNGSEFSRLSELEELTETLVYYTHPYTSCEIGYSITIACVVIRSFLPGRNSQYNELFAVLCVDFQNHLRGRIHFGFDRFANLLRYALCII